MIRGRLVETGISQHRIALQNNLPQDAVRNVLGGHIPRLDRADEICRALGLEFYIGPPRESATGRQVKGSGSSYANATPVPLMFVEVDLPVDGRAACSLDAQKHRKHVERVEDGLPEPEGLTDDPDAFYVIAEGASMVPEGISPGDYCVISPNTSLAVGQRLWMESKNGAKRIKRLLDFNDTHLTLRVWGEPNTGQVGSVNEEVDRSFIPRQGAVVGVFRDKPKQGMTVLPIPDPRAYEWARELAVTQSPVVEYQNEFQSSTQTLVRAVHAIGGNPIPDDLRDALLRNGMDDQSTDTPPEARPVDVIELAVAAGAGAETLSEEVAGRLWFRRDWLDEHGLDATRCTVIGVRGESMEPTLMAGSKILINRLRRDWRKDSIYVVHTDDGLVVKRADVDEGGHRLLVSDHPAWEDVPLPNDAEIIGEVVWMARTLAG